MNMIDSFMERSLIETREEWRSKWVNEIPYLHFDADWEVKIIPPFAGALARFIVKKGNRTVSVYFDGYSQLGYMYDANDNPIPYFEIYPSPNSEDVKRYYINETEEMLNDIRTVLND